MRYIVSAILLTVLLAGAGSEKDQPVYEWTLKIMTMEIPKGLSEDAIDDLLEYSKHKNEFKERSSVTVITKGLCETIAISASKSGILTFAVVPDGNDHVKFYGAFQKNTKSDKETVWSTRKIMKLIYNTEIELGSSAIVKSSAQNQVQRGKGEASVFLLFVRKLNREIPDLANDSLKNKHEKR